MNNSKSENGTSDFIQPSLQTEFVSDEGLLHIILRHRNTILCTVILFLVVAFIYILKATPIYTSTSKMYVEQSGPKIISDYERVMTQSKNYLYTQIAMIKSPSIIGQVAADRQVKHFKTFMGIDNVIAYIKRGLNIEVGKTDDIISIAFDSPYPQEAAQIVNKVVESYIDYHSKHKRSTAADVLTILQKAKEQRDEEFQEKNRQCLILPSNTGWFRSTIKADILLLKNSQNYLKR